MPGKALSLPIRVFRHFFTDRSYESYYSPDIWEHKYREENYDLGDAKEDGRYGALMRVLRRYDRGAMLDLGCGDGLLWKYYRPLSNSLLVGADYSETAVARANAMGIANAEFVCGDYRNYRPGRVFSAVVFNESLYYSDSFLDAVDMANGWLDDGGVIIISMFDTAVTRRIWKQLSARRKWVNSIVVRDDQSKLSWTIRVSPRQTAARAPMNATPNSAGG